jgi:uncharacterized protein YciI
MYYLLLYNYVDDYLERREPLRDGHLALAKGAHEKGDIVMAGALADPADGAVIIFKGGDPSAAERFVANDPYVKNGLVVSHKIRPWTVVFGGEK